MLLRNYRSSSPTAEDSNVQRPRKKNRSECPVCYLTHDDEIHEATLRIHEWFFGQVTRNFVDESDFADELQSDRVAG